MAKDEYGAAMPKTWDEAVKTAGSEEEARQRYPQLDPAYQKLIKTEGQAKGSADYAKQYIDPQTVTAKGYDELLDPNIKDWEAGGGRDIIAAEKGTLTPNNIIGVADPAMYAPILAQQAGEDIQSAGPTALKDIKGLNLGPTDPTKPGGGGGKGGGKGGGATTAPPPNPEATAIDQMFQSLAGQFTSETAALAPYTSGQAAGQSASYAQGLATGLSGEPVAGQNPALAAPLNASAAEYEKAQTAGNTGIGAAIGNLGQANAAFIQTSPYAGILASLQSEAQYKTETGTPPASITGTAMPAWLAAAYQNTVGSAPTGTSAPGASPPVAPAATTPSTDTNTGTTGGP